MKRCTISASAQVCRIIMEHALDKADAWGGGSDAPFMALALPVSSLSVLA